MNNQDNAPETSTLKQSIQDALDHALGQGDDRTAFDLATILRGLSPKQMAMAA